MYRLSKLRCVALNNFQGVTLCPNSKISVSDRTCSLYKQLECLTSFSNGCKRYQSTHTNPNVIAKKPRKKRAKATKKFAEMLVVRDDSTSECKARIHNLKPNDITMLALTNLDLSELYKLNYLPKNDSLVVNEHTYSNLNDLPANISSAVVAQTTREEFLPKINSVIIDELQDQIAISGVSESTKLDHVEGLEINEEVLISKKLDVAFQPEVIEDEIVEVEEVAKEEPVKKRHKPVDLKAKEEIINRSLSSYIEVCVGLRAPQRGLTAYNYHRYRHTKTPDKFPKIKSLAVFNSLLKGFAAKGDFLKLREVLKCMQEDGANLNVQSYAAIFECLARVNCQESHLKYVRIYAKDAIYAGITFDKIMNEATFLGDQRERVLETMRAYIPAYEPKYFEPSVQFCNHLVDSLNHEDQLKGIPVDACGKRAGIFDKEGIKEMIKKQLEVEKSAYVTVKSIEPKPDPTEEVLKYRQAWKDHVKLWEEAALDAFNRDMAALTAKRSAMSVELYMRSIPTKDFISIIVDEAKKIAQGSETYSPTVNMLYRDLGNKVYARYKVLKKQKSGVLDKVFSIHNKYCDNYVDSHLQLGVVPEVVDHLNTRQKWQWADYSFKHEGATIHMDHQEWVPPALQSIGKFLYNIVMHDIKIDVNVMRTNSKHKNYLPAFYTIFRNQGRIVKEEVKPHPILSRLYRASVPETLTFPAYEIPMKCPPIPWVSINTGGYLIAPCEVVRLPTQASTQRERLFESIPNKLYPSLDALNQLASIPWKVNKNLLDVILEVFKNGGSAKLDVPEAPSTLKAPPSFTANMDKSQRYTAFRQKLQYRRKKAEMYSLWCDCLYRLSLANHFREDIFWLPHNMDFRGRVYPIPPHLNHLGSDLARSMLVFAEGRPLGPTGLDWLKLHLINLTGLKKRDKVEDRLTFANSILDDILDSADRPLTGRKWWAESEEPWQTLACCMEIADATRSADPEKFVSHFPVHQDGSCNGLQHYAALGRDSAGAFSVNLTPASAPQDVYSAVAVLVEEKRKHDASNGVEIAKILDGFVKRKVIKQTVMTTVYGVTRFGARLQIARQLKDMDDFPKESVWSGSSYLTGRTFESLRTMFTSTREIQDWFTDCARLISSVCGQNVEWVTPLGLPIVQPYFRYKKLNSSELIQHFHVDKFEKPNVMKQKNAFPPNFIHSLDSSHMMLTSLYSERAGITFVSVHDCYWTHPSTVHIMNKICREQFVALHSEPILEDLSAFLSEKFSYQANEIAEDGSVVELTKRKLNRVLRKLPKTGNFDINEVLQSVYFFS